MLMYLKTGETIICYQDKNIGDTTQFPKEIFCSSSPEMWITTLMTGERREEN